MKESIKMPSLSGISCTWEDCKEKSIITLFDRSKNPWSHLCKLHFEIFDNSANDFINNGDKKNLKAMLGAYSKANGGAKQLTNKILRIKINEK